jgi:hypothetical protein
MTEPRTEAMAIMPIESQMKEYALHQLELRKQNQPEHIKNETLYAGSVMYFYCRVCGWLSDLLPEGFISKPRHVCSECQLMKDRGWLVE